MDGMVLSTVRRAATLQTPVGCVALFPRGAFTDDHKIRSVNITNLLSPPSVGQKPALALPGQRDIRRAVLFSGGLREESAAFLLSAARGRSCSLARGLSLPSRACNKHGVPRNVGPKSHLWLSFHASLFPFKELSHSISPPT